MESVTRVQILEEAIHLSFSDYSLGKGMNRTLLLLAMINNKAFLDFFSFS